MEYKVNLSDLVYEARFRGPLFALAASPVVVLEAIHSRISPKYPISSGDMVVDSGRAVGEIRARVSLFAGNGTLEVAADSFTARFSNPRGDEDLQVIQDCLVLTHDALSTLGGTNRPLREESVTLRIFSELADGSDASTFLKGLFQQSKLLEWRGFPPQANIVPGFVMDIFQDDEKWTFNFIVSQAARSKKEMFLATSIRFFEGNRFLSIKDKADHFGTLIRTALTHVDLQPQASEKRK